MIDHYGEMVKLGIFLYFICEKLYRISLLMNTSVLLPLYDNTTKGLSILLLICVIIVFTFIIWAVFVGARIHDFKDKLRKRLYAISILLSEKKDIILTMSDVFVENGIELTSSQEAAINCLRFTSIETLKDVEVNPIEVAIKDAVGHVKFLASTHPELAKTEAFVTLSDSLNDIDTNFRQAIAIYNSDLLGYNYWCKSAATHWLFHMFGNREKNPLN